jgi:hypothetical protein
MPLTHPASGLPGFLSCISQGFIKNRVSSERKRGFKEEEDLGLRKLKNIWEKWAQFEGQIRLPN